MPTRPALRIGTRGSLLALAQTELIKESLTKATGQTFEIKKITTQGDIQTDRPLWQLEGKDFFTKELDQALLNKEIDLVVHSYKDLGSERPEGIVIGAIPERIYPNDILLIKQETIKKLSHLKKIRIGTSSPRRIEHISKKIGQFLPYSIPTEKIELIPLRGNVNTRISKLQEDQFEAIILAMAGLERLARHPQAQFELKKLLAHLNYFILPLQDFPCAPAQGALAIEYHQDNPRKNEIEKLLQTIHHQNTEKEVKIEKKHFKKYGGGCHLAVGIYCQNTDLGLITTAKGKVDNQVIDFIEIENETAQEKITGPVFLGLPENKKENYSQFNLSNVYFDSLSEIVPVQSQSTAKHLFITSNHCLHYFDSDPLVDSIWVAGKHTLKAVLQKNYWVNGMADFSGHQEILNFQKSKLLEIIHSHWDRKYWAALGHKQTQSPVGETVVCYQSKAGKPHDKLIADWQKMSSFYWSSFSQMQRYSEFFKSFPKDAKHYCGMGKTYQQMKENNIPVIAMPNIETFLSRCHS